MSFTDNLTDFLANETMQLVLLGFFLVLLLVIIIYRLLLSLRREEKEAFMLREGVIPHEKMKYLLKEKEFQLEQRRLEEAKKAALILSQEDQKKLEDMDRQSAVMARKEIFARNELARRKQQLDYMTESNELNRALGEAEAGLSRQLDIAEGKPLEEPKKSGLFKKKKKQDKR